MVGMILLTASAVIVTVFVMYKGWIQKKEIYDFADEIEFFLDSILLDKPIELDFANEDSLRGKICERLQRLKGIWETKEAEGLKDKKIMKQLISDISHQVKTPIANQKIYLEILGQEELSDKGMECVESLERQANKLEFLFQSMVKTSRLETGIVRIEKQDTDFYQTLSRAASDVVPAASKKQIDLFIECEEKIRLRHDTKWTEEAIFNLLDNAVKYTEAKGTIHVTVSKQEIFTRISIKDSGKGIPIERQAQIFTRFYREPEVHNQEGVGIGLFLARKIAELQNGYIEVYSEPGKGSDFRIYLPNE